MKGSESFWTASICLGRLRQTPITVFLHCTPSCCQMTVACTCKDLFRVQDSHPWEMSHTLFLLGVHGMLSSAQPIVKFGSKYSLLSGTYKTLVVCVFRVWWLCLAWGFTSACLESMWPSSSRACKEGVCWGTLTPFQGGPSPKWASSL